MMHLNYLLAFDGVIASRGGIPLIEQGKIIGAIGCSGGSDSQDEVVSSGGRRSNLTRPRTLAIYEQSTQTNRKDRIMHSELIP